MYNPKNPKIDVYYKGVYQYSTNWYKTCKEAKARFQVNNSTADMSKVKAVRSK